MVARPADGAAGKGCWRKRRRGCNGVDTGSEFTRRENEQTSSRCLVTRRSDKQPSYGKADDGRLSCWCAHKRKRLVTPGRYREVSAGMGWRVSLSRSAFEMLERYAMKVARTVLRGGSGSNVTSLPDHPVPHYVGRGKRRGPRTAKLAFSWLWVCSVSGAILVPPAAGLCSEWGILSNGDDVLYMMVSSTG